MLAAEMQSNEFENITLSLLDCSLPEKRWTHAAHLTATLCLLREHEEIELHRDLPGIIKRYNVSQGGENTDTSGYHATLTHFFISAITAFNKNLPGSISTFEACKRLLLSPLADRDYPLKFYSKEKLFSIAARRNWVAPDLVPSRGAEPGRAFPANH